MPLVQVVVRPNARESRLEVDADGRMRALLRSPPVDGRANAELVALLARHFGCARADVEIRGGGASRTKWVRVPDPASAG